MIPNNNLSVLPWYTSIDQQNARKWWIYNKVYPLFTPATFMLPFQVMRTHRTTDVPGVTIENSEYDAGYLLNTGEWSESVTTGLGVSVYENLTETKVYLTKCPAAYSGDANAVMGVAYSANNAVLGTFKPVTSGYYTGVWNLPAGTKSIKIQSYNAAVGEDNATVAKVSTIPVPISLFKIFTNTGVLVGDYTTEMLQMGLQAKGFADYDVIVFPSLLPVFTAMANGQYYAQMSDGVDTWYSEIFTVVNDISPYLKLEWWDDADFIMDAGRIVYRYPNFKNVLYLPADIAKPEYTFEDESEDRDGYSFPTKQISKKIYHFSFLASEYLLDVMRFVRMADFVEITNAGQRYSVDSFLITPEWEDNGDVASVDAEFSTATVAKKIGLAYVKAQRGDFNDDFNDDYNNQ